MHVIFIVFIEIFLIAFFISCLGLAIILTISLFIVKEVIDFIKSFYKNNSIQKYNLHVL